MKAGIYRGLSDSEYDAIPAVRSSMLRKFSAATPAHWFHRSHEIAERAWGPEGRALHIAALQSGEFTKRVTTRRTMPTAAELGCVDKEGKPASGFRSKEQQQLRGKVQAEVDRHNASFEIALDPDEMERVTAQAEMLRRNSEFRSMLSFDHDVELTIVWEDSETGLLCKARLDAWIPDIGTILEVKGTKEVATVERFGWEIYRYGYHQQCAWYLEGVKAQIEGHGKLSVFMGVCEKAHPYLCAVRPMSYGALAKGRSEIREALRRFADCKGRDRWPGHDPDENWELPAKYALDADDIELAEELF